MTVHLQAAVLTFYRTGNSPPIAMSKEPIAATGRQGPCDVLHFCRIFMLAFATAFAMTCTGCLSIEEMAPPVDTMIMQHSVAGQRVAIMKTGRTVYITQCARCHSIEPIGRYSAIRWQEILERMIPKSRLDEQQTSALRGYVLFANDIQKNAARSALATDGRIRRVGSSIE